MSSSPEQQEETQLQNSEPQTSELSNLDIPVAERMPTSDDESSESGEAVQEAESEEVETESLEDDASEAEGVELAVDFESLRDAVAEEFQEQAAASEESEAEGASEGEAAKAELVADSAEAELEVAAPIEAEDTAEAEKQKKGSAKSEEEAEEEIEKLEGERLHRVLEAVLFAAGDPVPRRKLKKMLKEANPKDIDEALLDIERDFITTGRGFGLVEDASGLRLLTHADYAPFVARLRGGKKRIRLSQAAFETLAIVAYKQPVRRSDLDSIRGVHSSAILKNLLEWNLISIIGRDESVLGRPQLFGTTRAFLEQFGLKDLKTLPEPEEWIELIGESEIELVQDFDDIEEAQEDYSDAEASFEEDESLANEDESLANEDESLANEDDTSAEDLDEQEEEKQENSEAEEPEAEESEQSEDLEDLDDADDSDDE